MRALITGGAGFVGSHLAEELAARGAEVIVVDNFLTSTADNLRDLNGTCLLIEHDVARPLAVPGALDVVFHFASPASPRDYHDHPLATLDAGTAGTRMMLEMARTKGARFMLASTSEVYGDPLEHPQREDDWGNVNPIGPRSVYDEAKRCAEAYTMAYHRAGLDTRIARIFNTYGPRMQLDDGRVVPAFIDQALRGEPLTVFGDGSQTRSFCYVRDLVEGLYRLAFSDERLPVNLGNPQELTILEFAERIRRITGTKAPLEFKPLPQDDPKRRQPDISKAKLLLAWEPKVSLEEGLRDTIEYFQTLASPAVARS